MKIEWKGGECPVSGDAMVNAWLRDGSSIFNIIAGNLDWSERVDDADIIAYEVIEDAKEELEPIIEKTLRDEFAIAWINGGHQPSYDAYIFADSMMKARAK